MSRVLARCSNCTKPVVRAVRNDADTWAETEERYSIEARVDTFGGKRGTVREVAAWVPYYGLKTEGTMAVRCSCGHVSYPDRADVVFRLQHPDTPR